MLAIICFIFIIISKAPVDPSSLSFGQRNDPKSLELMRKANFLDRSIGVQIAKYLEDIIPFQIVNKSDARLSYYSYVKLFTISHYLFVVKVPYFRKSFATGEDVTKLLQTAIVPTLFLAVSSILIAIILGVGLGILAVKFINKWIDQFIMSFCSLGFSVPSYIAAIFISIVIGFIFFPIFGLPMQGSLMELDDLGNMHINFKNLILPSIALGIRPISVICQMTRSSILDIMHQEYIRTAKSKGISTRIFYQKHILKNAINPILTTISSWFASLLAGSFFIEYVFNYRGIGDLTINAMNQFDIPLILGCCIFVTILFIVINFLTDILFVILDRRIKVTA